MTKPLLKYISLLFLVLSLGACNLGKWIPEGEYRLNDNEIIVDDKEAPSNVYNILKQRPTPVAENWIYSLGNPNKESGFARWVSNQGTAPAIYNEALAERTKNQLQLYYFSKGYYYNQASYSLDVDSSDQKLKVIYEVDLGPRYYIKEIEYMVESDTLLRLITEDSVSHKIAPGDPYDEAQIGLERSRLANKLNNAGYFGFSKDLIRFTVDTTLGNHQVSLLLRIIDKPVRLEDTTYYVPHEKYRYGNIYIDYGFSYLEPNATFSDTNRFRDYTFLIRDEEKYHPHLITRAIHFEPGDLYRSDEVKNTYTHINSLGVFGATEIEYEPRQDSSGKVLDTYIYLTPLDKRSFTTTSEATNTSGNYGISGTITWRNRNFFKAGEILDLSLTGGIQAQSNGESTDQLFNTYELGAEAGMTFSRFLIPLKYQELFPKRMRPTTRIATSYSQQTRIEFQRRIFKLSLNYQWQYNETSNMKLTIPDFNYVNLLDSDEDYLNSLFFKTGFQDNVIAAIRFTYTYAPFEKRNSIHRNFVTTSIESSGNLFLNAADFAFSFPVDPESGSSLIFNVPYAQYVKLDVDYRHYLRTGPKSQLVGRFFGGVTYNNVDGNSPFLPPFEKNFLAGGSQDVRGWVAYRLGPGGLPGVIFDTLNYAAVAPLKLMINLEHRFPIIGSLHGAIFLDAGNVWLFNREYPVDDFNGLDQETLDKMKFRTSTFIRQTAVGTGFGLRYDFGFFLIRLDGGIKVWDPSEPEGYQYVLDGLRWNNVTYNFALGYPF